MHYFPGVIYFSSLSVVDILYFVHDFTEALGDVLMNTLAGEKFYLQQHLMYARWLIQHSVWILTLNALTNKIKLKKTPLYQWAFYEKEFKYTYPSYRGEI